MDPINSDKYSNLPIWKMDNTIYFLTTTINMLALELVRTNLGSMLCL